MRHYELVVVLKPTLSDQELNSKIESIQGLIQSNGAEVSKLTRWGRKNLAYPINNFNSGYYFIFDYKTTNTKLPSTLEYNLRIDEDVLRFLNSKLKTQSKQEAVKQEG